jgi:protein-serine/threonine kinase
LKVLKKAKHPFLVEYIDDFEYQKQDYCIITKSTSEGNFKNLMKKKKMVGFTEKEALLYLAQMVLSIEFMHRLGMWHRDLKPENIFV